MTTDLPVTVGLPARLLRAAGEHVRPAAEESLRGLMEDLGVPRRPVVRVEEAASFRLLIRDRTLRMPASAIPYALAYLDGIHLQLPSFDRDLSLDTAQLAGDRLSELIALLCRATVSIQPGSMLPAGPLREVLDLGIPVRDHRSRHPWGAATGTWGVQLSKADAWTNRLEILVEPAYLRALTSDESLGEQLRNVVDEVQADLGVAVPSIRLRPDRSLRPGGYTFQIQGVRTLPRIGPPLDDWTDAGVSHLLQSFDTVARRRAYAFLTPATAVALIDDLGQNFPVLHELAAAHLSPDLVARVLRQLLCDGVPIRNLRRIVQLLLRHATEPGSVDPLTFVRRGMTDTIVAQAAGALSTLIYFRLTSPLAATITGHVADSPHDVPDSVAEPLRAAVQEGLRSWSSGVSLHDEATVIVTPDPIRTTVHMILRAQFPALIILSESELPAGRDVMWLGDIG